MTEIESSDINLFVYLLTNKDIITVSALPDDKNCQFRLKLRGYKLCGCTYFDQIKEKSSVEKSFNNST